MAPAAVRLFVTSTVCFIVHAAVMLIRVILLLNFIIDIVLYKNHFIYIPLCILTRIVLISILHGYRKVKKLQHHERRRNTKTWRWSIKKKKKEKERHIQK